MVTIVTIWALLTQHMLAVHMLAVTLDLSESNFLRIAPLRKSQFAHVQLRVAHQSNLSFQDLLFPSDISMAQGALPCGRVPFCQPATLYTRSRFIIVYAWPCSASVVRRITLACVSSEAKVLSQTLLIQGGFHLLQCVLE